MKKTFPKILSVGTAFPVTPYTQRDIFDSLKYPRQYWPIFNGADIDTRRFYVPMSAPLSWQQACEAYEEGATMLTRAVVEACLDKIDPECVSSFTFASCTGYQCPSIPHRVVKALRITKNAFITPILGTGCEGGFPALKRAYDYTIATRKMSLAVSCEISSVCHFPEDGEHPDPTRDFELLRANAIFGDGASAILLGYDNNPRHPYLVDFETYFDPDNMHHLGFLWQDGRLRCLLSRQVPKIVPGLAEIAIKNLLARHKLTIPQISWWVIHPGGRAILDNVRDKLGLPEEKMSLSREVLRKYGNCSSAGIGIVGKQLASQDTKPGEWGVIVSFGAGLAAGATLIRFPQG